ncbi:MAG: hypothetical protein ACRER8_22255 [Pseudomonas sp.]|uniref:hypothetical protein n=1 Tax=Pseudomonas sp. TaxID=306 RepID=UPI003D6F2C4F
MAANQPAPAPTQPEAPTPAPSGYQQTGVGTGSNQIAMKIGDDGVPMFTNDAAAVAGAAPANQNQARGSSPSDLNQSFASLGSAKNMYDGIGQFSQAEAGDAQLAMGRWQKAADLRSAYRAQDRLEKAQGEKWQADHTNVVHDSSRPITQRELKTDAEYAGMKDRAARNVDLAQGYLSNQQANQQTGMQLRQAQRLEDALMMATAPNATAEQKQAYQTLTDPTNEKGLARQLTQAKINEANASADKQRNSINKAGNLPVGLQKLEDGDIDAVSNVQSINTQMGNILGQLDNGSLVLGPLENRKNAALNAAGQSNPQSVNYASFMSSLEKIRNDSLRLNKGPQTEGDAVRAWNELLANVNDPKVVKQRLGEIQTMNNKAAQVRLGMINSRRKNQGVAPLNIEDILGGSPQASQAAQPQQSSGTAAPAQQAGQGAGAQAPTTPQIKNDDDYNKLPSGTQFIDPQGMHRRKP